MTIEKETLSGVGAGVCCIIPPYVLDHLVQSAMQGFGKLPWTLSLMLRPCARYARP